MTMVGSDRAALLIGTDNTPDIAIVGAQHWQDPETNQDNRYSRRAWVPHPTARRCTWRQAIDFSHRDCHRGDTRHRRRRFVSPSIPTIGDLVVKL
jgi:hypothetical protein